LTSSVGFSNPSVHKKPGSHWSTTGRGYNIDP
jgi:hypothetical protein